MLLTEPLPAPPQYIVLFPIERNKGFAERSASSEPPTWGNSISFSLLKFC